MEDSRHEQADGTEVATDSLDLDGNVLAEVNWYFDAGGGGSPGDADSGRILLVRSSRGQPRYWSITIADGEWIIDRVSLGVVDDGEAIAAFLELPT